MINDLEKEENFKLLENRLFEVPFDTLLKNGKKEYRDFALDGKAL